MPAYFDKNGNTIVDSSSMPDHHLEEMKELSKKCNLDFYSEEFSLELDKSRFMPSFREKFYYPKIKDLPKG
jgi:hypothetical protein